MKKLLFLLMIVFVGCKSYPEYQFTSHKVIPDSLKVEAIRFVENVMEASSDNLTTAKYKRMDWAISQAEQTAWNIYGIMVPGLLIKDCKGCTARFIPYYELTKDQEWIYKALEAQNRLDFFE